MDLFIRFGLGFRRSALLILGVILGGGLGLTVLCWVGLSGSNPAWGRSLEAIVASGRLRVAVKEHTPPLGFRDPDGQWVGFEIDLARELARRLLGSPEALELLPVLNQDRLSLLASDQVDLVIAQWGITPARARQVTFTRPYYFDGTGLLVRTDGPIRRWSDLGGRQVVVLAGSDAAQAVRSGIPLAQLFPVGSYQDGLDLLDLNAVDAVAADITLLSGWIQDRPEFQLLDAPLSQSGLAVAIAKGTDRSPLATQVAQAIESLRQSGWLQERAEAWGLP